MSSSFHGAWAAEFTNSVPAATLQGLVAVGGALYNGYLLTLKPDTTTLHIFLATIGQAALLLMIFLYHSRNAWNREHERGAVIGQQIEEIKKVWDR